MAYAFTVMGISMISGVLLFAVHVLYAWHIEDRTRTRAQKVIDESRKKIR